MAKGKRVLQTGAVLLACMAVIGGMIYRLRQQEQHTRALFAAIVRDDARQVQAELDWGISPNVRDLPDKPTDLREYIKRLLHRQPLPKQQQYAPALLLAERNTQQRVARVLLYAGADPNATDSTGERPLIMTIEDSARDPIYHDTDVELALLMLAKGADPNTHNNAQSALGAALKARGWEVSRQLILRGANVNAPDSEGDALLTHATFDLYLTGLMLQRGADVNAADADGDTVLMLADEDMTPLLIARGANVNAKDARGYTTLRYASERDEPEKIRWLLRYGADCKPAHNGGWNLLCWSAAGGHLDIARMALARGIGVNERNGFGRTPLMFAASKGDAATIRLLLAHGANVNAQDKGGMTALMYAAQKDYAEAVRLLLRHGTNLRLRDREHKWTALQYAQHFCAENAVAVFLTGKSLPLLPADSNPNSDDGRSRIRVDAKRWFARTLLALKDDPNLHSNADFKAYAFCLADNTGQQGKRVVLHCYQRTPAILAFQDGNGQCYVYVEAWEGDQPGGTIYQVKGLDLLRKWSGTARYGVGCTPLPGDGALIRRYYPDDYIYGRHNPRTGDIAIDMLRFRHGVMQELGTRYTPGE